MAGLSFRARNAINSGYSGTNPEAEYGYAVGSADSAYNIKQLEEQMKLAREQIAAQYAQSIGDTSVLSDITGYSFDDPGGFSSEADTTKINNLANLMTMLDYANQKGLGNPTSEWSQMAYKINQMARKGLGGVNKQTAMRG